MKTSGSRHQANVKRRNMAFPLVQKRMPQLLPEDLWRIKLRDENTTANGTSQKFPTTVHLMKDLQKQLRIHLMKTSLKDLEPRQ